MLSAQINEFRAQALGSFLLSIAQLQVSVSAHSSQLIFHGLAGLHVRRAAGMAP
ncbi:MAG: hypothetical protein U1E17_16290 [Geminicoccaceae bacterium]